MESFNQEVPPPTRRKHISYLIVVLMSSASQQGSASNNGASGDAELQAPVIALLANATIADYATALRDVQLFVGKLQKRVEDLQRENAVLRANQPKRKPRNADVEPEVAAHEAEIAMLGRAWLVCHEPFIQLASAGLTQPRPATASSNPDRYKSALATEQGFIAELYEHIPARLHAHMPRNRFIQLFCQGGKDLLSSLLHTLRGKGTLLFESIPNVKSAWFEHKYDRSTVDEFQKLLLVDRNYVRYCPLLYPDFKKDQRWIFDNIILKRILKLIMFGPSSLSRSKVAKPKTNAILWGVSSITPGMIAFAAIVARFIISPDPAFAHVGDVTKASYLDDFNQYKALLMSGSPTMDKIIRRYNTFVFGDIASHIYAAQEGGEQEEEDFEEVLRGVDEWASDNDHDAVPAAAAPLEIVQGVAA
ncbi:hypothetical protein EUX98_g9180, partial [Antrodiella citrinella]